MSKLNTILSSYQKKIELGIDLYIKQLRGPERLNEVFAYGLQNKGKRLRPAIVLMVAEALGQRRDVMSAALAVELFHTASLVADDLPCMDDADQRRGEATTHCRYGEASALLASYAHISAGYEAIYKNAEHESATFDVLSLALKSCAKNTGLCGATGGQFYDLFPEKVDAALIDLVMEQKTGALFELSFVLGWLFGGGDAKQLLFVERVGMRFGTTFQLMDDLLDYEEDRDAKRPINYALFHGFEKTQEVIAAELSKCQTELEELGLASPSLLALLDLIRAKSQL